MKEIQLTRKVKEQLSAHFDAKGTVHNVTGDLARVPLEQRQTCYDYWQRHQRHRKSA